MVIPTCRLYRDALAIQWRLITTFTTQKTEGETLTLIAALPIVHDAFLSNELTQRTKKAYQGYLHAD